MGTAVTRAALRQAPSYFLQVRPYNQQRAAHAAGSNSQASSSPIDTLLHAAGTTPALEVQALRRALRLNPKSRRHTPACRGRRPRARGTGPAARPASS